MRKTAAVYLLLPLLLINITGCVPLIIGGAVGVVGGYAVSKDTIQGDTNKPYEELWDSALTIVKIRGAIKEADTMRGYIQAQVESNIVWIRLIRLTQTTTRLRISVRNKYHFPNLSLAQDIYTKLMDQVR